MARDETLEILVTADTKKALRAFRKTSLGAGAMGGAVVAGAMMGLRAIQTLTTGIISLGKQMGKIAVESAIEYEFAIMKVFTMLDITSDRIGELNEGLEEQAKAWGIPATKQASAAYLIASGLTKDLSEAQLALVAANKLAVVGFDDLRGSTAAMITVMAATGADLSKVDEITQKLWATVRAGILETENLEDASGKLAGAFKFVPFEEVMAAFSVLTRTLGGTEIAATSLNRLIMALTETNSKGARAAKELGIEFGITALKEKGFMNILKELNEVFETDIQAWKSTVPEMRAFRAASGLVGQGLLDMESNLDTFDEKMLLFGRLLPKVMATTRKELDRTKEKWADVWRDIGENALDPMKASLKELVAPCLEDFAKWSEDHGPQLVEIFNSIALAAAVTVPILGDAAGAVGTLGRSISTVYGIFEKTPLGWPFWAARKTAEWYGERKGGEVVADVIGKSFMGLLGGEPGPTTGRTGAGGGTTNINLAPTYVQTKDPQDRLTGDRSFTEEVTAR